MTGFDPRSRVMDAPRPGFWLVRCCKGGPWCPAAILRLQTIAEPGLPDNLMDRSPHTAAFVSGQPVALADVWHRRGRIITRAEYDRALSEIAAAVRGNVYDPRCQPYKPVAIDALPIPFEEEARARQSQHRRRRAAG